MPRWQIFFLKNVLMQDQIYRDIHKQVVKLQPRSIGDVLSRHKSGKLSRREIDYLEAAQTLSMREKTVRLNYLENCFNKSQDWTHA